MRAMGSAYTDLLADRPSLLFQMQSYAACADPEIQAGRARALRRPRAAGRRGDGRDARRAVGVLRPRDAAQRHRRARPRRARAGEEWAACWVDPASMHEDDDASMLDRLGAFIYRRRRAVLWGSLAVVLAAGVFGGPVFGLLDSGDDFDDPQAEAVLASRDVAARDGRERVARPRRARAARRAGRLRGGAGQARPGRGGAARPRDRARRPATSAAATATSSPRTGAPPTSSRRSAPTPAACSSACSRGSSACPA